MLHMQSDVPVGLTLSGGLDSTILCHDAMQAGNLSCYSLQHPVAEAENPVIDETVRLWGLKHTHVPCSNVESTDCIDEILRLMDQPFRATQTLYQYGIRKAAAADGVRVLLTGDGADEVFGGYTECVPHAIAGQLRQGKTPRRQPSRRAWRNSPEKPRGAASARQRHSGGKRCGQKPRLPRAGLRRRSVLDLQGQYGESFRRAAVPPVAI